MTPAERIAKRAEMARRWLAGETGPQIVEAIGVQLNTIHRWRIELGLPPHGPNSPPAPSTLEILPRLRELRAAGLSVKQCAARLGISKNSAAGICHRNNIPSLSPTGLERANAVLAAKAAARRAAKPAPPPKAAKPLVRHPTGPVRPPPIDPEPEEPRLSSVPAAHGCCWPIGNPGRVSFRWCDAPLAFAGSAYCLDHRTSAYSRERRQA